MLFSRLGHKLIGYFLIVILFTSLGIGMISVSRSKQVLLEQNLDNFNKIAQEAYFNIEQKISEGEEDTYLLSSNKIVTENVSYDIKRDRLIEIKNILGDYEDILISDADGNIIVATDYLYSGRWEQCPVFKEAIEGKISISNVHLATSPPRTVISLAGPVYEDNKLLGVVAIQLNTEGISEISNHIKIGDTGFAFIVDDHNKIVAHPDSDKILTKIDDNIADQIKSKNKFIKYKKGGRTYIGNYFQGNKNNSIIENWAVIVVQEEGELFKPLDTIVFQIIIASMILIIFAILLSIIFSKTIVTPIVTIKNATKKIIQGNLDYQLNLKSKDEIGELASVFNQMTCDLKKSRVQLEEYSKNLENTIKERTKELQSRNEELEKFNKLTVGRELRMIDLKKKIKELEEQLQEKKWSESKGVTTSFTSIL